MSGSLVVLCAVFACDRGRMSTPGRAYGDWDSAGVHISVDSAPSWTETDRWTLDIAPHQPE